MGEATTASNKARENVDNVRGDLLERRDYAKDTVDGKTADYKTFAKEQRAIAYGTCAGVCAASAWTSGGATCAVCYATAAGILETKLRKYREKNEKIRKQYDNLAN